jgi:hypothetical protein
MKSSYHASDMNVAGAEITGLIHSHFRYALGRAHAHHPSLGQRVCRPLFTPPAAPSSANTEARDLTSPSCIRNVEMCQALCSNSVGRALSAGAEQDMGHDDGNRRSYRKSNRKGKIRPTPVQCRHSRFQAPLRGLGRSESAAAGRTYWPRRDRADPAWFPAPRGAAVRPALAG